MATRPKKTLIRKTPTKSAPKSPRKSGVVALSSNTLVKDLRPKDVDAIYYGAEPNFSDIQPTEEDRNLTITLAFNWYSHFYGPAEAKEFILQYLDSKDTVKSKIVRRVPENKVSPTTGFLARMSLRGLVLNDRETNRINDQIAKLISYVNGSDKVIKATEGLIKPERQNIQELMRERAGEASGEIDAIYDEFIAANCPKDFEIHKRVLSELDTRKILPQHVPTLIKSWERLKTEHIEATSGKDEQLVEGYQHYSKTQMKNCLLIIDQIISALNAYIAIKQATKTKTVRVRKPVPVEKTVSKLKYLKTFKDDVANIELISITPTKLHNSTEAYLYDTAKRKLIYLIADEYSKCLTVKGSTVLGFDTTKSQSKTLRKPQEQLTAFMKLGKPAARKFFTDIKSVAAIPNGRTNDKLIILKVN